MIFGVLGIACAVLCMFLPETYNKPLPDVLPKRTYCLCVDRCRKQRSDDSLEIDSGETNLHKEGECIVLETTGDPEKAGAVA